MLAIRKHRSKKDSFNLPLYDSFGIVTYGRGVDRNKGKFARRLKRRR